MWGLKRRTFIDKTELNKQLFYKDLLNSIQNKNWAKTFPDKDIKKIIKEIKNGLGKEIIKERIVLPFEDINEP